VDHFLFPELKRIILKTEAVGDKLREALSALDDIRAAFIYGSTARGTELASSDIDLMIIGDVDLQGWLREHVGHEVVLVAASIGETEGQRRTCRICGREYDGLECPHCRDARLRLRGG